MNFVGNTIFRSNCLNSELKNICFFYCADISYGALSGCSSDW